MTYNTTNNTTNNTSSTTSITTNKGNVSVRNVNRNAISFVIVIVLSVSNHQ